MIRPEDRDLGQADPVGVRLLEGDLTPLRYRLRPSVEAFLDRAGALCFVVPGGEDLLVRRPDRLDVALVRWLRAGDATAAGLAGALGADVATVQGKLDSLVAARLVLAREPSSSQALSGEDAERFSRQLPYLAELGDEAQLQRRLRSSTVAVVGCGGLGTWAVAALACSGVGRLVLVDDDRVALSNLNRQILYTRADVGTVKVTAAARWIAAFDPGIEVRTAARRIAGAGEVGPLIAGADAVVLAADWPPYDIGRWVNAACAEAGIAFIVAGQVPPILKIGPTYAPGVTACLACHEAALRAASPAYDDYVAFRRSDPGVASTVGAASAVVGGLIGLELLHLLTGHRAATQEFALIGDMRTLRFRREPVARDPGCRTCKS